MPSISTNPKLPESYRNCIPLTGNIDVFSLRGPPAYYTPISLGPLGGLPAYKPLTREGTHQITQRGRPAGVLILMG